MLVWSYFKSFGCALISFLAGIFIDLDHPLEYYLTHNFTLDIRDMFQTHLAMTFKKLYVAFHSYEIVIFLWLAIAVFSLSNLWKAMAIGLTQHLIFDQMTNPVMPFAYFFAYRASKNFDADALIKKE